MILSKRPEIDRFLADPGRKVRAALIHGRDRGGVRERADLLAGKIAKDPDDPFDTALLTETDLADPARLDEELQAISMMGGRRLIRVRLGTERANIDKLVAAALKTHTDGGFNPDAFLIVEAGALGKDSALRKAAEKADMAAAIPVYDDEPGDVMRLIREALAKDQVGLAPEALELFAARLPHERGVARAEIERLILFIGPGSGRTLAAADLEQFLGVEPEASLSDAAADAFSGKAAPAQAGLRRAQSLHQDGMDLATAAKASGVFWKQEREFLRQARAWTLAELDRTQPDVLEADRACKQAGSLDDLLAERLLLSIAGRARRLGL